MLAACKCLQIYICNVNVFLTWRADFLCTALLISDRLMYVDLGVSLAVQYTLSTAITLKNFTLQLMYEMVKMYKLSKHLPQKKFCWQGVTELKRLFDAIATGVSCATDKFCFFMVLMTFEVSLTSHTHHARRKSARVKTSSRIAHLHQLFS